MPGIALTVNGSPTQCEVGTTGTELFKEDRSVVAMRVDGELKDLFHPLRDGNRVDAITIDSPEGLEILRHSCAHVLAQAVQDLYPEAKLGIGPPIEDGFYYDFDVDQAFTPQDLKAIEKQMNRIVREGQTFNRRVVEDDQAQHELSQEPYKLELISIKGQAQDTEGASVEVGGDELTMYDNVRRNGEVAWTDLCRGPHLPSTRIIGNGFALMRTAAAYWRGDENNPQLQRIYGTAWPTKAELKEHQERLAEAERRDHRRLGAELDLFSFPEQIGSGLPVFHPKGGTIRNIMEEYSRKRHIEAGYQFVNTPHITKSTLFETSGHLDWYAESMYPPMHIDEERDAEGVLRRQGQDYYLKPMNCPMHILIYQSAGRSYRELPMRMFEFGTVYRYEKSGVVHGLTRARGFTQDDAHIFATRGQMKEEIAGTLTFILDLLKDYGLDDFYLEISTKNPEKFVGSEELWEESTQILRQVGEESGLELVEDPGGAAFYGPKVSVQARDAIGRTWQMSTVQLDLNLPELFDLEYQAANGERERPVMIHRALFGSIERFFGVLVEHYAGAFPPWLAPVQVTCVPVAEVFNDYLHEVAQRLKDRGIRVEVDTSEDRFNKKIRTATKSKVPFILIAGGQDQEANAVSFRYRNGEQRNTVPIDEAVELIVEAVETRAQV